MKKQIFAMIDGPARCYRSALGTSEHERTVRSSLHQCTLEPTRQVDRKAVELIRPTEQLLEVLFLIW